MPFLALTFDLGSLDADTAEAACFAAGTLSVTLSDARDDAVLEPAPGEVRLWPATRLQALFAGDADTTRTVRELRSALGLAPSAIEVRALADRAWEREWLARVNSR